MTPHRRDLLRAAAAAALAPKIAWAAPTSGFSPAERAVVRDALGLGSTAFALDDAALTGRVLAYARIEAAQRIVPTRIDPHWALDPPSRDLPAELASARAEGRLAAWLASLPVRAPGYRALLEARPRYALMADAGGWPTVGAGPALRPGDEGPRVAALRARLATEGYGGAGPALDAFDEPLATALRTFQAAHGLAADGVAGVATVRALDVPAAVRLEQIDANLERWRWTRSPPADRVVVDTGQQTATLFRGGRAVLRMRAIVGSPEHPTPMFRADLKAVVFSPPWNVPDSIARNELLPAAAKRPGLLESMGIRRVDGRLQQRPGPKNSLGLVKFDLDSPWGVYLHDTPAKGLFGQPVRDFSHGCMRLEKPRELAAALLGWSGAAVDAAIAEGATRRLALRTPVPLLVVHRTVQAEAGGPVRFWPDIYGWDRRLAAALPPAEVAGVQPSGGPERVT